MNKAYKYLTGILLSTLLALVVSISTPVAKADVISISPPRFELFGNPGDVVHETLKVRNDGDSTANYTTAVEDFTASGDDGGININEDPDAPKTNFSLARWLSVEPSNFSVDAGQERLLDITIRIPKEAEAGGHYASVQIKMAGTPSTGSGASVETRLNSLILLRVSGNIAEKLTLSSFKAEKGYYQNGPVTFDLRTTNEGNVHVAPTGTIVITDMFKRKVAEVPLTAANVLPGSSRAIKTVWDNPGIGRYTATLVANYGTGSNQPITATASFIVMPLWLIWTLLGILVVLILLIVKRKSFKRFLNKLTAD